MATTVTMCPNQPKLPINEVLRTRFEIAFPLIDVLSCVLNELCEKQTQLHAGSKPARNKFSAQQIPAISLLQYLNRIARYSQCSNECFVLALIYIDRIIQTNPTFQVNYYNIHRLLITSVMLAAKFFDDQYFNNTYYARVGGVDAQEMNQLEVEFLFMTNFFLAVPTDTYGEYFMELSSHNHDTCMNCAKHREQLNVTTTSSSSSSNTNTNIVGNFNTGTNNTNTVITNTNGNNNNNNNTNNTDGPNPPQNTEHPSEPREGATSQSIPQAVPTMPNSVPCNNNNTTNTNNNNNNNNNNHKIFQHPDQQNNRYPPNNLSQQSNRYQADNTFQPGNRPYTTQQQHQQHQTKRQDDGIASQPSSHEQPTSVTKNYHPKEIWNAAEEP